MSKLSLQPNASGAGTFTLAAPDSNTNRTLTLPDEAGKLLSTGNDDPAEVFKQNNILGTVSESSGVPTGAIIERGSNANGEFVKYADGTQICRRVFRYDSTNQLTFDENESIELNEGVDAAMPANFLSNDTTAGSITIHADSPTPKRRAYFGNCEARTTNWRRVTVTRFGSSRESADGSNIVVELLAIGLWF